MATEKQTARACINLMNACLSVEGEGHSKFLFATKRNETKLKELVKHLEETRQEAISKEFYVYQAKRENIFRDWQKKLGKPEDDYNFGEHTKDVEAELKALYEEYEVVLKDTEKRVEEWTQNLEDEVDVTIHKVAMEHLPQKIYPAQLSHFKPMVSDWNIAWDQIELTPKVITYGEAVGILGDWTQHSVLGKHRINIKTSMKLVVLAEKLSAVSKAVKDFRDNKMGVGSKFKEFVTKRLAIMRDETLTLDAKSAKLGELLEKLPKKTRTELNKVEEEVEAFLSSPVPEFKVPVLSIEEFDTQLSTEFIGCVFDFISEEE